MKLNHIAYFSMEIALDDAIPTYSGGLGVLAGDILWTAHDLKIPMVGVSLLFRKGYFTQVIDSDGNQTQKPTEWKVADLLQEMPQRIIVQIDGRDVVVRAWKYSPLETGDVPIPIYLLDTDLPENNAYDRSLSQNLYGGDLQYRLCQEIVLGIGGIRMLFALGYDIEKYHLNEGHSSLLTLELLTQTAKKYGRSIPNEEDVAEVRSLCSFTTHTPVPAGHDQFPLDMALRLIGRPELTEFKDIFFSGDTINLTHIALRLSSYVNGVAKKHQEVSKLMFPEYDIDVITNGVRVKTWVCPQVEKLFNQYIPSWSTDAFSLRYASSIPHQEIWNAHLEAKESLFTYIKKKYGIQFDKNVFTLGFARRMTGYKRATLLFDDLDRLKKIVDQVGPLQIIFGGKAHPDDTYGKEIIHKIFQYKNELKDKVKIVFLENYDRKLAKLFIPGVDVWLNTPERPLEASGTSGMKAAVNGVPSLSVLDGWWIEGHIEGLTGWAIGDDSDNPEQNPHRDAAALLEKLEHVVMPLYYNQRDNFIHVMLQSISLNGSFFNTQRMLLEYLHKAYSNVSYSRK
jgi:starch phosphorylase